MIRALYESNRYQIFEERMRLITGYSELLIDLYLGMHSVSFVIYERLGNPRVHSMVGSWQFSVSTKHDYKHVGPLSFPVLI